MNRLSDYVSSMLIHRCPVATTLSQAMLEKSCRLRTRARVNRIGEWLGRYSNLNHLVVDLEGTSRPVAAQLSDEVKSMSRETCERLRSMRILDKITRKNVRDINTILPILERCVNLEMLEANVLLSVEDVKKLAILPAFRALAANPIRMYVEEHESVLEYELVQAHLPHYIKLCLGCPIKPYGCDIKPYRQRDLFLLTNSRCVRQAVVLSSDVELSSKYIESLGVYSKYPSIRMSLIAPNLTSLHLRPCIVADVVAPRLVTMTIEGDVSSDGLSFINKLPNLTSLCLTDYDDSPASILSQLKCPSLTHLTIAVPLS